MRLLRQLSEQVFGCKVIGSAGGPGKGALVTGLDKGALVTGKFGFDACVDYKGRATADDLKARVKAVAPEGIDMYFNNVRQC